MRRPRQLQGEDGATLVIVLAALLLFSLIIPALLTASQSAVLIVSSARDIAQRTGDAAGAAETAVDLLRRGVYDNAPGQPCFHDPSDNVGGNDSSVLSAPAPNGGATAGALVTCQPDPLTGYPTRVKQVVPSPTTALLAFPRGGEPGIKQNGNNVLRVAGKVYSNGAINVPNNNASLIDTNAGIFARGTCTGTISAPPANGVNCGQASSTDPLYNDPGYLLPGTVPVPAVAPTCAAGTTKYQLQPGTYTSAVALSALNQTSCGSPLVLLTGGTYYFDFQDAGSHVWDVSAGYLVGGQPKGWTYAGYPSPAPTVPGSCVDPAETTGANGGVQLIFGGDSRIAIGNSAAVELCGMYDSTRPPIAIFGANAGNGTTTTNATVKTTGAAGGGSADFANQGNIKESDGAFSTATPGKASQPDTKTVTVSLPYTAPAGAVLSSAKVRIRHVEQVGPAQGSAKSPIPAGPITSLSATLRPTRQPSGPVTDLTVPTPTIATVDHEDTLDVTSSLKPFFDGGFTGASITYTAGVAANTAATENLDSIQVDLAYTTTTFRREDLGASCVGQYPYTASGSPCALVKTTGNASKFYVAGTTYAPLAALDITLNHITRQVFGYGLVSRSTTVAITGSADFTSPVISVPDTTTIYPNKVPVAVYLQVYLCPGGGCPAAPVTAPPAYLPGAGWVRRLSARVDLSDPTLAGPRSATLLTWSHVR